MAGIKQALELEEFIEQPLTYSTKSSEETNQGLEFANNFVHSEVPQELEKKDLGRHPDRFISMYKSLQTQGHKSVKKDNERTKVVRVVKKGIVCLLNDSKPKKGILTFDRRDSEKKKIWEEMEQMVLLNYDQFKVIKDQNLETPECLSYKSEYCKHFYTPEVVRVFHFYSMQLIYGTGAVDPSSLCQKLKMSCCDGRHKARCSAIWERVRHYVMFDMIFELDLEPIGTDSAPYQLTQQIAEINDPDIDLEPIDTTSAAFQLTQPIAEIYDPDSYLSLPNP